MDKEKNLYITQEGLNDLYAAKEHLRPNEEIGIYSAYRGAEEQYSLWIARLEILFKNILICHYRNAKRKLDCIQLHLIIRVFHPICGEML